MRLLADENIPGPAVAALRRAGHEVVWMSEESPGSPDAEVLERAVRGDYLLLTFDKDFGALTYERHRPASCDILLFRLPALSKEALTRFVVRTLAMNIEWHGFFSVIDERRIRRRPLPNQNDV